MPREPQLPPVNSAFMARAEWDFSQVPQEELAACLAWEIPRSSKAIIAGAAALRAENEAARIRATKSPTPLDAEEKFDLSCVILEHLHFPEWPERPFLEVSPRQRHIFRLAELGDEGLPRNLDTAMDMQDVAGEPPPGLLGVEGIALIARYGEEAGAEKAESFVSKYLGERPDAVGVRVAVVALKLDLLNSDEALCAGFREILRLERRARRVRQSVCRGGSNSFKRHRDTLRNLAAARLLRVLSWEDAYLDTKNELGKPLYGNRPELWKPAAKKGEELVAALEKQFTSFYEGIIV